MSVSPPESVNDSPHHDNDSQLDSLRNLLLSKEQQQIQLLEAQLQKLEARLTAVQADADTQRERANALQAQIDTLKDDLKEESEALVPRIIQQMNRIIRETIHNSRHEMAEALGPIMSDAIRAQIRDSRKSMVEALYPIILETVQRALAAFARELQRNIDARLKNTFQFRQLGKTLRARIQGVSPAELTLRNALPFDIEEMFLIQHESGLVLSHISFQPVEEERDSDLVSAMLTAIRDFAKDSFYQKPGSEGVDEVGMPGDDHIILSSGEYVYLAVVIDGIEPTGFRMALREFVAELHLKHRSQFRDYDGDPDDLPTQLPTELTNLRTTIQQEGDTAVSQPLSRSEKQILMWGGLGAIVLIGLACFYLQFTLALWPFAFGQPTPTPTPMPTATNQVVVITATPENTPLPTATPPPTATAIPTNTHTPIPPTATHTPTPIPPTATHTPTASPLPAIGSRTNGSVWVRPFPDVAAPPEQLILVDTAVAVHAQFGEWVEISWRDNNLDLRGWVPLQWITLSEPIPNDMVTPVTVVPVVIATPDG